MSTARIERVDSLPLILTWLLRMHIHTIIDGIWLPNGRWQGLNYGQLALLFVAYVIHQHVHRLMSMEGWLNDHRTVIEQVTGWTIGEKEATDDRLGLMLDELGQDEEKGVILQERLGQHLIQAYELPTKVGRYDTSSFSVHHAVPEEGEAPHELLRFGHSKDNQPGRLQFKQGLGTLDPAGVPLLTHTLSGEVADDGLYLPAWRQMQATLGRNDFLFVADCKAAAMQTRAGIATCQGSYLFPLPMTGETPAWLQRQISQVTAKEIVLPELVDKSGQPKVLGEGFVVERSMSHIQADQQTFIWQEQWFVTRSYSLTARQQASLQRRLSRTEQDLQRMHAKKEETLDAFTHRIHQILHKRNMAEFLQVEVGKTITTVKRYLNPGRPGPNSPFTTETRSHFSLTIHRNETALATARQLAGWRIHVSNAPSQQMDLTESVRYYRDEWLVEHGFHRFKKGSLPALPLYLHLPDRIRGLMLLLLIALQALTLIDFVARRSLAQENSSIAGLVPGNPKMKTDHPSAERLLAAFDKLHLVITETNGSTSGFLLESLSPLQCFILDLLHVPLSVYDLRFNLVPT